MREYGDDLSVDRQKRKSWEFKAKRFHCSVLLENISIA